MNQIISLSGGKDSTAMLHLMLEKGEPIHSVIFFDTGWEFPQMYDHLDLIEKKTGIEIVRLKPKKSFLYWMLEREVRPKPMAPIKRLGYGWPSPMRRWCTREKIDTFNKYANKIEKPIICIGYAYDESDRQFNKKRFVKRFPLIEYKITEKEALNVCKKLGYTWNGLYDVFDRVSCYCCPLQKMSELRKVKQYFPDLWANMLSWDKQIQKNIARMENNYKWGWFDKYQFLSEIDRYLESMDKQLCFSDCQS